LSRLSIEAALVSTRLVLGKFVDIVATEAPSILNIIDVPVLTNESTCGFVSAAIPELVVV